MTTYALMKNPGYTRVSFQNSTALAVNELGLMGAENIREENIGGVSYILFDANVFLGESDIHRLSRLSFVYAIFEIAGDLLRPIALNTDYFLNSEVSAILKYPGKTNELFTRLMLNLAQFHMKNPAEGLNILDPLAGKGTTLFEALMQGHNAYGVEVDVKLAQESVVYLKKYLETAKYKHETHKERISGDMRNQIKIARSKGEAAKHFEMVEGNTRNVSTYFKKNYFHAIIADLPNKKPQGSAITRNTLELITDAMPGWVRVLKPGGVIVLAWNLFIISREEIAEVLGQNDITVVDTGMDFAHRVDQAVERDVIIGVSAH